MKQLLHVLLFLTLGIAPLANLQAQCFTTIKPSNRAGNCMYARSRVVWQSLVNTAVAGNTLSKTAGGNNWNAGAIASDSVYNGGYLETTIANTNTFRMIGLAASNPDVNYTSIRYAFYFLNNGTFNIFELGADRGSFGSYAINDIFIIKVFNNIVYYYKNGTMLYQSALVPTLPLLVDISIYSPTGSLSNVFVVNPTDATFNLSASALGTSPTYDWTVNGVSVSSAATYINTSLSDGDVLQCTFTPGAGGCSGAAQTSNTITIDYVNAAEYAAASVRATTATGCQQALERVTWKDNVGCILDNSNTTLTKVFGGNNTWNAGAASENTVANYGQAFTVIDQTNTDKIFGLSSSNADVNFSSIRYGFNMQNNGSLNIIELGTDRGNVGTYANGDTLRIAVENSEVKYYRGSTLLYISALAPTLPLIVDVSFHDNNARLKDVHVLNTSAGTYTCVTNNVGASPSYQWKLNGANVGSNSDTYTNTSIAHNDLLSCVVTPNSSLCTGLGVVSADVRVRNKPIFNTTDLYVKGTAAPVACLNTWERVIWTQQVGTRVVSNTLSKIQGGNNSWNAGAASLNTIGNNGQAFTVIDQTNTDKIFGLSTTNTNATEANIRYGLLFQNNGTFNVFENNTDRGSMGTYVIGDTMRIAVDANEVKYYRNNTLLYISTLAPTLPLIIDVSLNDNGARFSEAFVINGNGGTFTCEGSGLGTSPTYQWKLNGANVGTNSNTYTNNSLTHNDIVTCEVIPDLGGCSSVSYIAQQSLLRNSSSVGGGSIYVKGTAAASACLNSMERVVWINRVGSNASTTTLTKIQGGNNSWNAGAASENTISNGGQAFTVIDQTNTDKIFGLSTTNADATQANIRYGLLLQNNGTFNVFENNTDRGSMGVYTLGDTMRIAVENNEVKYYRNNTLLYISTLAPTLPLIVDVSLNDNGARFSNTYVLNGNTGTFTCVGSNLGTSPTYQWKLNGANVGTNSDTYTNNALTNNDIITCVVTPDLSGCAANPYTTEQVIIKQPTLFGGGDIYVKGTAAAAACLNSMERVVWINRVGSNANTTTLTKIQGGNNTWNAGAASENTISNGGQAFTVIDQTNTDKIFGLSTTNTDASFGSIRYGFNMQNNAALNIIELGIDRGNFGVYANGDTLRIAVESNEVKYYRNNTLLYISTLSPTLPLIVDVSLNDNGARLSNTYVLNGNTGTFTCVASNAGTSPTFQWKLNGADVGTNSNTYTNLSLSHNDVITCVVTPDLTGCGGAAYTTEAVVIKQPALFGGGDIYVKGTPALAACLNSMERAVWVNRVGSNANTTTLTKIQGGNNSWNAGAASENTISNGGQAFTVIDQTNTDKIFGLSTTDTDAGIGAIRYGFNMQNNAALNIIELGIDRGNFGVYANGDTLRIAVESNEVKYYRNNTLLYISTLVPTLPLIVDVSLNDNGARLKDVYIINGNIGTFTCVANNAGTSPTFQWKLNGANVGTNSNTYTNLSLSHNDIITCVVTPDLTGCGGAAYTTEPVTMVQPSVFGGGDLYVKGTAASFACLNTLERVTWVNRVGSNASTTTLTKIQGGNNSWNAGAASENTISNGGQAFTVIDQTSTDKIFGLSTTDTDAGFGAIRYGFNMQNNAALNIIELGVDRGNFGIYANGDTLRIAVESNEVKYYRNNTLLYISTLAPTLPLIIDVSLNDNGARLSNTYVLNGNTGTFTCVANNTGTSPIFQWKLNGTNVGTNSNTYTNLSLSHNDVITCVVTPDLTGCGGAAYITQPVVIKQPALYGGGDIYVKGSAAAVACQNTLERITWVNRVGSNATTTTLTKIQGGNNSWNAGAASENTISNGGQAFTVIDQTNTDKIFGLSTTNLNATEASIRYGFNMQNNTALNIIELGIDRGNFGVYANGDTLRIAVENNEVKYYRNNALLYISTLVPTLPLIVDVSLNDNGARLSNTYVLSGSTGTFTCVANNAGTSPTYQWKLNGVNVGTNASTYVNTNLAHNDVITCAVTPDFAGCANAAYLTEPVIIKTRASMGYGNFYAQGTAVSSACKEAIEEVVWTSIVGCDVSRNDITKIQGGNNTWNAGAISVNTLGNNGYMTTVIDQTNQDRVVGLSASNPDVNFSSVRYAFLLQNNGTLGILEAGANRGNFGTYAVGQTLKIAVENNVVRYYRNNVLLYSSALVPSYPLFVDISINDNGGKLNDVFVANPSEGNFSAAAFNVGTNPMYQWRINGADIAGANSGTYSNANLANGDTVTCAITPDLGGCSGITFISNNIIVRDKIGTFYARGVAAPSACKNAFEQASWRDVVNIFASGNDISKGQGGNNNWNAGIASNNTVADNGFARCVAAETNRDRAFGLSTSNTDAGFNSIQYAILLQNNGTLAIYESGANRGTFGSYTTNDTLKIAVENGVVNYYRNNTLLYISALTPTLPLLVDISLNDIGATLKNVEVVNGNVGVFTAVATNVGASPAYQWKLNGVIVGTNSATYTNTALVHGDVITCDINPDLDGCTGFSYTSMPVTIRERGSYSFGTFFVQNAASVSACKDATEQVVWKDLVNLKATGNRLDKIQGGSGWNAGAASLNTVINNGSAYTVVNQTNSDRMFGLSNTNTNANFNTIQYAFYLQNNGSLRVYESGTDRGTFGTYTNGDTLRVAVENNEVKYYKNSTLLYISAVAPTLPLIVDVSLEDQNGILDNVNVVNGNTGVFTVLATNSGASPTYQWKLNGGNVGSNSSTYTNTALTNGDVVTCTIRPNLGGCQNITYTATNVTISDRKNFEGGDIYAFNNSSTNVCAVAVEQVVWTSLVNATASGNTLTKAQGTGWNAGAASFNVVRNNGYAEMTANATNRDVFFGLSTTNANAANTSIQYAFWLQNGGGLRVYESGADRGSVGSFVANDVLRITAEGTVIRYYKNGNLVYTSAVAATLPLVVDASMEDAGGIIRDAKVGNLSSASFTVSGANLGASPTYQWRVNSSNAGTNAPNFTPTNLLGGDTVYCLITPDLGGCTGIQYRTNLIIYDRAVPTTTTWLGTTSGAWANAANWSNGVPNERRTVVIPSGTPFSPNVSASTTFYSLSISNGATLTASGSPTLTVYKDWANQGVFSAGNSTIRFEGCAGKNVISSTTPQTFSTLYINNPDSIEIASGNVLISNNITFNNGIVNVKSSGGLYINDNATVSAVSNNSYVKGRVHKTGNDAFTFPVGDGGQYRGIGISAPASITDQFSAEYFAQNPTAAGYNTATRDDSLGLVNNCFYWDLDRTVGTSSIRTTVSWEASCPLNDVFFARVAHWNGTKWVSEGKTASAGTVSAGTVTSGDISSFSPITSGEQLNILPVTLLNFKGAAKEQTVRLSWQTASETNNEMFVVERSADNQKFVPIGKVIGAGNSNQLLNYGFVDNAPLAAAYYRLKQIDYDGKFAYSHVVFVRLKASLYSSELVLFPNPAEQSQEIMANLSDLSGETLNLKLTDMLGREQWTRQLTVDSKNAENTVLFNTQTMAAGVYMVSITASSGQLLQQRLVITK